MMLFIEIPGEPVAQGRPRATTINGRVRLYDPVKSKNYKEHVRLVAQSARHRAGIRLFTGPLRVRMVIHRKIPTRFRKREKELASVGKIRPTTKPDSDNYSKSLLDAMNGIIYEDDSQVVDLSVSKFYSENPRVEIRVEEIA